MECIKKQYWNENKVKLKAQQNEKDQNTSKHKMGNENQSEINTNSK